MNIHDDAMQRLGRPNVPDLQAQIDAMVDRSAKEADEIRSWRRACESYEQNVRDQRKLLAEAEATIATLREQLAGFAPYLKEGETPLERLTRERADNDALLTLLARAKGDVEAAQAENATLRAALTAAQMALMRDIERARLVREAGTK